MKKLLFAFAAIFTLSGSMFADTITSTSGGFSSMPGSFTTPTYTGSYITTNTQVPFWNNPSQDILNGSHAANIGNILTDTGATFGNVLGSDTVSTYFSYNGTGTGSAGGGSDPNTGGSAETINSTSGETTELAFNLVRDATAYQILLLFADSSMDSGAGVNSEDGTGTIFGTYTMTGSTFTPTPIMQPTDNISGSPISEGALSVADGTTYGFYATVCYGPVSTDCETYTTGNGNFGGVSGAQAWNHFALFQLASGSYAIGFEDGNGMFTEGIGDFNDLVIELQSVPEPATFGIMGLGLAALGFLGRRRFAKR